MLNLNYYAGSVNGANYQDTTTDAATTTRQTVISIINRVCNKYSIDEAVMIGILDKYPEFTGYVMNTVEDYKVYKMIQDIIVETLEEEGYIYEEEDIIDILTSLNCDD